MQKTYRFVRDLVTDPILMATLLTVIVMLIAGCGASSHQPNAAAAKGSQKSDGSGESFAQLSEPTVIRVSIGDVAEKLVELPAGSVVGFSSESKPATIPYRDEDGHVVRSHGLFIHPVTVVSVPEGHRERYSQEILDGWNSISGGLFLPNQALE